MKFSARLVLILVLIGATCDCGRLREFIDPAVGPDTAWGQIWPPPLPPLPTRDWSVDAPDLVMSHLFDDPASTPEEIADSRKALARTQSALLAELQNVPSDVKALYFQRFVERLFGRLKERIPEGLPSDPLIDLAEKALDNLVDRIIPERSRPSHQAQVEQLLQALKERHPEADIVIEVFAEALFDLTGPYLAVSTSLEDGVRTATATYAYGEALFISVDVARREGRPNPLTDRIPREEFEQVLQELQDYEQEEQEGARLIREQANDFRMSTIISRIIQKAVQEQARQQAEQYRYTTFTTGPSYSGSYSSGYYHGGSSGGGLPSGANITMGVTYDGIYLGAEESPAPAPWQPAPTFEQETLLAAVDETLLPDVAPILPAAPDRAVSRHDPEHWFLPDDLGPETSHTFVVPAIQQVKSQDQLGVFEYRNREHKPIAFVFVADTSATLQAYSGAVSTCTQTTFGCELLDIVSDQGLFYYVFQQPDPDSGRILFGAQWLAVISDKTATFSHPVIPQPRRFAPGTRLVTYQVLAHDRTLIRTIRAHVESTLAANRQVTHTPQELPETWIRDAQLFRDRVVVQVRHRGAPTTAKVLVKFWQRTYAAGDSAPLEFQIPLEKGDNALTARLPWFPGACSVEVDDGVSKSLAFLQREIVPLGDTQLEETAGSPRLREGLLPLLGFQRGVVASGTPAFVYLPFDSFKQRAIGLGDTTGLAFDVDVTTPTRLSVRLQTDLQEAPADSTAMHVELHPGRNAVELPWPDQTHPLGAAYGVILSLCDLDGTPVTTHATIRQVALITSRDFGRHLRVGNIGIDFGDAPEIAVVTGYLAPASPRRPLWLPPEPSQAPARSRIAGRVRIVTSDKTVLPRLLLPAEPFQNAEHRNKTEIRTMGFCPDDGWSVLPSSVHGDEIAVVLPQGVMGRTVAFEIGSDTKPWMTPGMAAGAVVVAVLVICLLLCRGKTRRWATLIGRHRAGVAAAVVGGVALWTMSDRSLDGAPAGVYWPFQDAPVTMRSERTTETVLPTIAPSIVDPIAPAPALKVSLPAEGAPRRGDTDTVFADFRQGCKTVFGAQVGGFADSGASCTAECVPVSGEAPAATALQILAHVPPGGYAGVWLPNRPAAGINLADFKRIRFEARSAEVQTVCVIEIKRHRAILGACRAVIPTGRWNRLEIPIDDLVPRDTKLHGFDEIVFKFTEPSTHLLIANLRFAR